MDGLKRFSRPLQTIGVLAMSLATVAATTIVLIAVRPWLTTPVIVLLFLLPVILAATRWGLRPALAVSLVAFLTFNYFFLDPLYTLSVKNPDEFLALLVFLVVAVLFSQLVSAANEHAAQARARELESTTLYNLSRTLTAPAGLDEVLSLITRRVTEAFDLAGCEILLAAPDGNLQLQAQYRVVENMTDGTLGCTVDIPLVSNQVSIGVMRLVAHQPDADIDPAASRVLNTFAAQLGLAIERARLAREAARARLLEESDQLKSALLSSVSHDLRTPLSAIKAAATVLLQQDVTLDAPARRDMLSTINEESDRLNRLVGDLLDMSRIEAGALHLKLDWCDLDELIRSVARRLAQSTSFEIQMDWPRNLPLVYADDVQLDRVITNLMENAIRFAPPDTMIRVKVENSDTQVTVSISNEGPAILPQARAHLFDKFYRISEDRIPGNGTGLGLSICKGIVEAHGGRIWVESPLADNKGACFVFTLPFPSGKTPRLPDDASLTDEKEQDFDR